MSARHRDAVSTWCSNAAHNRDRKDVSDRTSHPGRTASGLRALGVLRRLGVREGSIRGHCTASAERESYISAVDSATVRGPRCSWPRLSVTGLHVLDGSRRDSSLAPPRSLVLTAVFRLRAIGSSIGRLPKSVRIPNSQLWTRGYIRRLVCGGSRVAAASGASNVGAQ